MVYTCGQVQEVKVTKIPHLKYSYMANFTSSSNLPSSANILPLSFSTTANAEFFLTGRAEQQRQANRQQQLSHLFPESSLPTSSQETGEVGGVPTLDSSFARPGVRGGHRL